MCGKWSIDNPKWNENNDLKFICKEYDSRVIPFLLFNLAIRNIDAEVIHCDVLSDENSKHTGRKRVIDLQRLKK